MYVSSMLLGIVKLVSKTTLLFYIFESVAFAHILTSNTKLIVINAYCLY